MTVKSLTNNRLPMLRLKTLKIIENREQLSALPDGKMLINTINAHSYNMALRDPAFAEALICGDALIPDGVSIVKACRWLRAQSQPTERIAGWDLFCFEMEKLNRRGGKCFFMGSSEDVLTRIKERAATAYPNIQVATYSPPYKPNYPMTTAAQSFEPSTRHAPTSCGLV